MELLLWRHAEAIDATTHAADLERHLTARGEKQAQRVAHWLCTQLQPSLHTPHTLRIVASPATRCQQTAHSLNLPVETDARLAPDADVADLLAAAHWPDGHGKHGEHYKHCGHDAVLLVGHQPTLGRLAALLLSGQEAEWTIKKGALWWFSLRKRDEEAQVVLKTVINTGRC